MGEITFHSTGSNRSGGIEEGITNIFKDHNWSEYKVQGFTIDYLFSNCPAPDFIKMDIEGSELEALKGASAVLNKFHPMMLIEIHPFFNKNLRNEIFEFCSKYGYKGILLKDSRYLFFKKSIKNYFLILKTKKTLRGKLKWLIKYMLNKIKMVN